MFLLSPTTFCCVAWRASIVWRQYFCETISQYYSLLERYMKYVFVAGLVTGDFFHPSFWGQVLSYTPFKSFSRPIPHFPIKFWFCFSSNLSPSDRWKFLKSDQICLYSSLRLWWWWKWICRVLSKKYFTFFFFFFFLLFYLYFLEKILVKIKFSERGFNRKPI